MKTHLLIEIDHSKALPDDVTDDVANRVYTMLHARGIACDVTVKKFDAFMKREEYDEIAAHRWFVERYPKLTGILRVFGVWKW